MEESIKKIVKSYYNPTIEELIKVLENSMGCHFILIAWQLEYGYWYIHSIYDKLIEDKINDNDTNGWYIKEEPNVNNIPIMRCVYTNQ